MLLRKAFLHLILHTNLSIIHQAQRLTLGYYENAAHLSWWGYVTFVELPSHSWVTPIKEFKYVIFSGKLRDCYSQHDTIQKILKFPAFRNTGNFQFSGMS